MTFTPAQQAAISYDAPEILVSAAAGSGKTAVLTERILRHIGSNIGIDRLLVVTFTEAAAAEMKERITEKIHNLQQEYPSQHLADQAALLAMADISTIHAFCRKLVKEHFQLIDIDPAFRVADDAELGIIRKEVMDQVFEEAYNKEDNVGFIDLVDVYGGKAKDEGLDVLVRKLYTFLESDPFPMAAAMEYTKPFNNLDNIDKTPWAGVAKQELITGLEGIEEGLSLAKEICHQPNGPEKYIDKIEENQSMIQALKNEIKEKPFSEMYDSFLRVDWGRLPSIQKKDEVNAALKDRAQRIREREAKTRFKDLMTGVFFAPPGKMHQDLMALAPRVEALMNLVAQYSQAFAAEKLNRNLLDFSDLEHFAIKVLYPDGPKDMTPGPVASALSAKYYEVLIDEYQDSNRVQDLILKAVAPKRFMVGDVKQSIYRFRRANPGLFIEKYNTFTSYEEYKNIPDMQSYINEPIRIDLSQNFRSRSGVIDAVNFFFSQLMCSQVGEVSYDDAAALHAGAKYEDLPENTFPGMWVELLDQTLTDPEEEPVPSVIAETRMIASCIHEVLATRQVWDKTIDGYRPSQLKDIVILARSANSLAKDVIEELKACGIDAIADMTAAFYQQMEIKTALAFLRVTDNPRQDTDLITVLSTPVYSLTPDELLEIKQSSIEKSEDKDIRFYDYLLAFSKSQDATDKVNRFMADLESWRSAAVYLPISRLLGMIYDATDYPSYAAAMPGGDIRQANLRLLMEKAIEFEETSFKGLFHFMQYTQGLHSTDSQARVAGAVAPLEDMENRVRFMSIHKSKGLEFPIVITAFLGKTFNLDDERQPIILHGAGGLGPKYVNLKKRTRSKTLAHYALSRLTRKENLSEEMRCLYVAMTRAKELLILTGRTKSYESDMEKWSDAASSTNLSPYYRQSAGKYLDWVMPCLLRHQDGTSVLDDAAANIRNHSSSFDIRVHHGQVQFETPAVRVPDDDSLEAVTMPILSFQSKALPSKLSITEIKRQFISDASPDSTVYHDPPLSFDPPSFIQANENITPMGLGSAFHTIVEHMDFIQHRSQESIKGLIASLIDRNLLTAEIASAIDLNKIITLANSPLAARIRLAKDIRRETPFVMAVPANEIYLDLPPNQESILVHGIIDCYFEESDGLVLVDFKTENPGQDITQWVESHRTQLNIYRKAIEEATSSKVKEVVLYSFVAGSFTVVPHKMQ